MLLVGRRHRSTCNTSWRGGRCPPGARAASTARRASAAQQFRDLADEGIAEEAVEYSKVARRVDDLVICVTEIPEKGDILLPNVGDTVQFSGGAVGHCIALGDLSFAAALSDPEAACELGEGYRILPMSYRPLVARPEQGGLLVDQSGTPWNAESRQAAEDDTRSRVPWFQEMVGLIRRERINSPLHSGVIGLDAFVPIGRGQSMVMRMPAATSDDDFREFMAHIIEAQSGDTTEVIVAASSVVDGLKFQERLANCEATKRLTIVSGRGDKPRIGEAVLAMNAACALAEAARDDGKDALLIVDVEHLYRAYSVLTEVVAERELSERTSRALNEEIDEMSFEQGREMWKFLAHKNAATARRRTFLGCFLQRACRVCDERGGGSLTLLAFARLKDSNKIGRLELQAKLKHLQSMTLDETLKAKAISKIEEQLANLPEGLGLTGVPDDFIEEVKAVTDGHVVFLEAAVASSDSGPQKPRWCLDVQESVARGITSHSVQNRPLDKLKSLFYKVFLMSREGDNSVIDIGDGSGRQLDSGPLLALLQQPAGDVLYPEDEAALLLLAMDDAVRGAAARPLADQALALLTRAKVRGDDGEDSGRLTLECRTWAVESMRQQPQAKSLEELGEAGLDSLCSTLDLRPLERKRVLAVASDGETVAVRADTEAEMQAKVEDPRARYTSLRERLAYLHQPEVAGELLEAISEGSLTDTQLQQALDLLERTVKGEELNLSAA